MHRSSNRFWLVFSVLNVSLVPAVISTWEGKKPWPNNSIHIQTWYLESPQKVYFYSTLAFSFYAILGHNRLPRYDWWGSALGMRVGCGSVILCMGTYNPEDAHLVKVRLYAHGVSRLRCHQSCWSSNRLQTLVNPSEFDKYLEFKSSEKVPSYFQKLPQYCPRQFPRCRPCLASPSIFPDRSGLFRVSPALLRRPPNRPRQRTREEAHFHRVPIGSRVQHSSERGL